MDRYRVVITVLLVTIGGACVGAQTAEETRNTMQLMQMQTDRLQQAHNALVGETKMRAIIDDVYVSLGNAVIYGWAFRCGTVSLRSGTLPLPARLDVLIDGLPTHAYFNTHPRDDVRAAGAPICGAEGTPTDPGVMMLLDLRAYAPGYHTLAFKLTDDMTGAVETSPSYMVMR